MSLKRKDAIKCAFLSAAQRLCVSALRGFDFCIIDTPGDTSPNSLEAIKIADLVVIPCKPTAPDLKAIGRTISLVQENNKNYAFVLTQSISRANATMQAASILSEFGSIAPSIISNRIAYANAMAVGDTASNSDKLAAIEVAGVWDFIMQKLNMKMAGIHGKEKI